VHKYLLPGYIDALFWPVLRLGLGISGLALGMAARFCGDGWFLREQARSYNRPRSPVGASLLAKGPALSPVIRAIDRNLFLPPGLHCPGRSVTIRGVSTKLKVNSGRTHPHGQPSSQKPFTEKSGNDPSMVSR